MLPDSAGLHPDSNQKQPEGTPAGRPSLQAIAPMGRGCYASSPPEQVGKRAAVAEKYSDLERQHLTAVSGTAQAVHLMRIRTKSTWLDVHDHPVS